MSREERQAALARVLAPAWAKAGAGGKLALALVAAGLCVIDEATRVIDEATRAANRAAHCPRCEAPRTSGAWCDTCGWRYAELWTKEGGGR